ncbi:hypothetical protein ACE1ET_13500 [Saccharicrinis sp. FJH62]|uniref:hypothetical protein n=1 Tax=Saccharicrinis sp. FJH62 TaxID=3344657 RepID=UPI0035D4A4CB
MKNLLLLLFSRRFNPVIVFIFLLLPATEFLHAQNDSVLLQNVLKTGQYGMGLSSQVTGTSKLKLFGQPLIILDGMPYYTFSSNIINYATADLSDIANMLGISEEEIESVTVLTDPTDLMSYGSAAKNGAIFITTKRATNNNIYYNLKTRISWEKPKYNMLDNDQYINYLNEAYWNRYSLDGIITGAPTDNFISYFIEDLMTDPNYRRNTNWFDEITQTGFQQEHTLSLSGQHKGIGYRFSSTFNKETETIINTGNTDYNFRLFLDYKVRDLLYISGGVDYINRSNNDYYKSDNVMDIRELALKMLPNMSIYEYTDEGEITENFFLPTTSIQGSQFINPVALAMLVKNNTNQSFLNPKLSINLQPFKSLSYYLTLDYLKQSNENILAYPDLLNSYFSKHLQETANNKNTDKKSLNIRNRINFRPNLGTRHILNLFGEYNSRISEYSGKVSYVSPYSNVNIIHSESTDKINDALVGLNYKLLNKYQVEFISSTEKMKLNRTIHNRTFNYGGSLQWIISNESFFTFRPYINSMRFKVSKGITYNPYTITTTRYEPTRVYIDRLDTVEVYESTDFDLNTSFLNNKILLKISYFKRSYANENLIATYLPVAPGAAEPNIVFQNSDVHGWEILFNSQLVNKNDFKINFGIVIKNTKNSISYLNFPSYYFSYSIYNGIYPNDNFELNKPFGEIAGLKYMGVYQYGSFIAGSQDDAPVARDISGNVIRDLYGNPIYITYKANDINYIFQGGDAKYQDQNFDGTIDENDVVVIGDARPLLSGTFGPDITFKRFWLGTFFNFSYGNDIVNLARMNLENMYTLSNQTITTLDRWKKPGEVTDVPRAVSHFSYNWLGSTRFVEDGSFLRLKALTLKYALPEHIREKLNLKKLSFYATAKNLFTWTKYKGANPDINLNTDWYSYGFDSNYAVPIKEIVFGVNIGI